MAILRTENPCWFIDHDDDWEKPHYFTETSVDAELADEVKAHEEDDGLPVGTKAQETEPCIVISCECGDFHFMTEDENVSHFRTVEEAVETARRNDFQVTDRGIACSEHDDLVRFHEGDRDFPAVVLALPPHPEVDGQASLAFPSVG